jgi:hypothetical protein
MAEGATMPELIRRPALQQLALAIALGTAQVASGFAVQDRTNADAQAIADFHRLVGQYRELHEKVAKGPAELKQTNEPAKIRQAQQTLAARIRAARKDARAGDIFTPPVRESFKRLMAPEMRGAQGREKKAEIREDAPKAIALKVNAHYPEKEPLPTVPASVLANLPKLPEDLEYRIIDRHLILRDVDANLIVDFIPNAIPAR